MGGPTPGSMLPRPQVNPTCVQPACSVAMLQHVQVIAGQGCRALHEQSQMSVWSYRAGAEHAGICQVTGAPVMRPPAGVAPAAAAAAPAFPGAPRPGMPPQQMPPRPGAPPAGFRPPAGEASTTRPVGNDMITRHTDMTGVLQVCDCFPDAGPPPAGMFRPGMPPPGVSPHLHCWVCNKTLVAFSTLVTTI